MKIQTSTRNDSAVISALVTQLSVDHIVGSFSAEGRANMLNSMTPKAIKGFFDQGFRYHVGIEDDQVVAVVGTRDDSHLFHLFVADNYQGKGYASKLWSVAKQACLDSGNNPGHFTVNSSLNSQDVYKRWGFSPIGGIREGGGVRDLPMRMELGCQHLVTSEPGPSSKLFALDMRLLQLERLLTLISSDATISLEQSVLSGSCLCGAVSFEIEGKTSDIYQCHCSVCRKATGTSGISVFLTSGDAFKWLSGEKEIQLYKTASGYRSVFCGTCGSRLPDPNPEETIYWVPAGLLTADQSDAKVGAHIFVGSKASWDVIGDEGIQHPAHFPS